MSIILKPDGLDRNPKDAEFFERAKTELSPEIRNKLVAFGSTRRKGIRVARRCTDCRLAGKSKRPPFVWSPRHTSGK